MATIFSTCKKYAIETGIFQLNLKFECLRRLKMKWTNKGHQFDELGSYFKGISKIYIYGAGKLGAELFHLLTFLNYFNCEVIFIDEDETKQKSGYFNVSVLAPEEFFISLKDKHVVIVAASSVNTEFIMSKLLSFGYKDNVNCFTKQTFIDFLPIFSMYTNDKVFFPSISFLPTTRCNLNCEACLAFSPYNKSQKDLDIDDLKADVDKFFECVDYIQLFHICGGEPLLYKKLGELIEYIGDNYKSKIYTIATSTNCTIIPSDKLCEVFKKYNVHIILDDYTETVPQAKQRFESVIKRFADDNLSYMINKVDRWIDLCPLTTDHSEWSEQKLINYYDSCQNPFQELRDKKLYSCNYASYAMKVGLNLESCNDYYDLSLFTPDMKKELLEFRLGYTEKGYVDFCRKCSGCITINKNFVEVAKQIPRKHLE
jgi:organic radical activating enzyme